MKKLTLSQGKFALVDEEDYIFLSRFKWTYYEDDRALISVFRSWKTKLDGHVRLTLENCIYQREIGCHNPIIWINGDRLDFQKKNLTTSYNGLSGVTHLNRKLTKGLSVFKGVSQYKNGKWRGQIEKGRRKTPEYICIAKVFNTEIEAAKWYNQQAIDIYGANAYQNKI